MHVLDICDAFLKGVNPVMGYSCIMFFFVIVS